MSTINRKPNSSSISVAARRERLIEIIQQVKAVCKLHGGMAEIGEGFVVVDTKVYEVKPKCTH